MGAVTERVKTFLFLSVSVLCMIQGLSGERWQVHIPTHMCAVTGSSVVIPCSFTRPPNATVEKIFWTSGHLWDSDLLDHPNYRGRVQYSTDVLSSCTLTVRDVEMSDAEEYFLRIITTEEENPLPKEQVRVTLSVVELSVEIAGSVIEGGNVKLSCKTSCNLDDNPAVIWRKNGLDLLGEQPSYDLVFQNVRTEDEGAYSCVLKYGGSQPSKPVVLDVMYAPKHISASVSPSGEIVEGSLVTLTCSSDANPPVENYTWFKKTKAAASVLVSEQIFTIAVVNSEHTGYYFCEAKNKLGLSGSAEVYLDVQYLPKNTSVSVFGQAGDILKGDSVTLTCRSDANPPVERYTWHRRTERKQSVLDTKQRYTIARAGYKHTGYYYCTAMNKYGASTSAEFHLDVQYAPKNTSASVSPSGDIVEGTSVTLTCSSDANPPVQIYTWYRMTGITGSVLYKQHMYTITKANSEHTGSYYCEAQNKHGTSKSPEFHLNVQSAPKNTLASVSPSGDLMEGSSVTLTCSSDANPPAESYTWYRRHGTKTSAVATSPVYSISNITPGHIGYYYCRAMNKHGVDNSAVTHLDVYYAPKYTSVSLSSPDRNREGSSVTLTCNSDANPPVKNYTWFLHKNGTTPTYIGSGQHHQITDLNSTHSGHYYCEVENTYGFSRSLEVYLDVKLVRWQKIVIVVIIGSATFLVSALLMCVVCSGVKKCSRSIPAQDIPDHLYEEVTAALPMTSNHTPGQLSGDSDDVQYATVQFQSFRGQQRPAHSTNQRHKPHAQQQRAETEYATVYFHTAATQPAQETVIYSNVLKPRNIKLGKTSV